MEKAEIKVIRFSENDVIATSEEDPPTTIELSGFYDGIGMNSMFGDVASYTGTEQNTAGLLKLFSSISRTQISDLNDVYFFYSTLGEPKAAKALADYSNLPGVTTCGDGLYKDSTLSTNFSGTFEYKGVQAGMFSFLKQ